MDSTLRQLLVSVSYGGRWARHALFRCSAVHLISWNPCLPTPIISLACAVRDILAGSVDPMDSSLLGTLR